MLIIAVYRSEWLQGIPFVHRHQERDCRVVHYVWVYGAVLFQISGRLFRNFRLYHWLWIFHVDGSRGGVVWNEWEHSHHRDG